MIAASSIINGLKAELDAQGSGSYTESRDYIPAINKTTQWLVSVFNSAFGQKKLSEESLRELLFRRVFVCSKHSRLNLIPGTSQADSYTTNYIWTILGVYPNCRVKTAYDAEGVPAGTNVIPPSLYDPYESVPTGHVMTSEHFNTSAERSSIEEWESIDKNIFKRGSSSVTNSFSEYSYLTFVSNIPVSSSFTQLDQVFKTGPEIEIKPALSNKFVGVVYLKLPTTITSSAGSIEFPQSIETLFVQKAVDFITRRNYSRDSLYKVTQQDVVNLISLMT